MREKDQDTSFLSSFKSQLHFGRVLRAASFLSDCRPFCVLLTAVLAPATPVLAGLFKLPGVVTASHLGKLWVLQCPLWLALTSVKISFIKSSQSFSQACLLFLVVTLMLFL